MTNAFGVAQIVLLNNIKYKLGQVELFTVKYYIIRIQSSCFLLFLKNEKYNFFLGIVWSTQKVLITTFKNG